MACGGKATGLKAEERCLLMTAKRFSMLPRNLVFVTASA